MTQHSLSHTHRFTQVGLTFCLLVFLETVPSIAQQSSPIRDSASPKKVEATWGLQAKTIAHELGLSPDAEKQVAEAYLATRKTRQQLLKELPKAKDEEKALRKKSVEAINTKQREVLQKSLQNILSKEPAEKSLLTLGSFNSRWDKYVSTVSQFQLDAKKQADALGLTAKYMMDYTKARATAEKNGERFSSVTARDLKAKLDSGIAKLLSEEQLAHWNKTTAFQSGGAKRSARGEGKRAGKQGGQKSAETIE